MLKGICLFIFLNYFLKTKNSFINLEGIFNLQGFIILTILNNIYTTNNMYISEDFNYIDKIKKGDEYNNFLFYGGLINKLLVE